MKNNNIREIVQICESISTDSRIPLVSLSCLCSDGTVWRLIGNNWKPLPMIPQIILDDPEPEPEEYPEADIDPEDTDVF